MPERVRAFLEAGVGELRGLGFEVAGFDAYRAVDDPADAPERHSLLLEHEAIGVWATLAPSAFQDPASPFNATFIAYFEDDTSLASLNGIAWGLIGRAPAQEVIDPYAASIEEQWTDFRARLEARSGERRLVRRSIDQVIEIGNRDGFARIDAALAEGVLARGAGGESVLRSWPALELALGAKRGLRWRRELAKRRRALRTQAGFVPPPPIPVELKVAQFERSEALRARKTSRQRYLLLFVLSAIGFALSMLNYGTPKVALAIVAILFLHELGHYTAMRAFGYSDTTMFFIPFFGAATVGNKRDAMLHEEMIMLFAGPVPGIVLALCLAVLLRDSLHDVDVGLPIVVMFAVNAVNLLPFFPLDGGRIVDALLLSRIPGARAVFRFVAAAAFLAVGVAVGGDGGLIVLGVLTLLSVPSAYRGARLEREVMRRAAQRDGEPTGAAFVFECLAALGFDRFPLATRYALARPVVQALKRPPAARGERIVWLAFYCALLGGFAALIASAQIR